MPSTYAHYRFGVKMLQNMPADLRRTVNRFRRLYDVGLHGPDPFFYYNPLVHTKTGDVGHKTHELTGQEFFERVCRSLRLDPSEGSEAYLYGMLCHYCLDSVCHPFVNEKDKEGHGHHVQIESEFDRYLLELDGKNPPESQDLSNHIQLTAGEAETMSRFYPGVSPAHTAKAVKNMAFCVKVLATPQGARRKMMRKGLRTAAKSYEGLMLTTGPDPQCADLDAELMELYRQAEQQYPAMLENLNAHLTYNAPLGDDFKPTFG